MTLQDSSLFNSTSRLAGERAAQSIGRRYQKILDYLQEHGPSTLFEVSASMALFDHQISGRFTELAKQGLIVRTGERRRKPETNCEADVWRLAERLPPASTLADRLGYPQTLKMEGEIFDRGIVLEKGDAPGIPFARRADGGGVRLNYRVEFVECGGCGKPLRLVEEKDRKTYRCGTPDCNRTWHLQIVQEPGQRQVLALVMKHL